MGTWVCGKCCSRNSTSALVCTSCGASPVDYLKEYLDDVEKKKTNDKDKSNEEDS